MNELRTGVVSMADIAAHPTHRLDAAYWLDRQQNPLAYCHDCGDKLPDKPTTGATGYALRVIGTYEVRICYSCADDHHRAELETETDTIGYVSSDGKQITTWTGGELMKVVSEHSTPFGKGRWYGPLSARLWYYRAVDANGNRWYGKGSGRGMNIRMHKAKGVAAHGQNIDV
jgi:hypothetical protein